MGEYSSSGGNHGNTADKPPENAGNSVVSTVTRRALTSAFADVGLRSGDAVLVHTSLRSLGLVEGGAGTVVRALLDAVGLAGTIIVPTFTAGNSDPRRWALTRGRAVPESQWDAIRERLPPFDPRTTPSERMGAVAEAVRNWPGAVRSSHPQTSFAAIGPAAAALMEGHERDCHLGPDSPLARLVTRNARVLLLGVSWAACTAFHLAEYQQQDPPKQDYECVVLDGGRRRWYRYEDVLLDDRDFDQLGRALEASPARSAGGNDVKRADVGATQARSAPIGVCVDFARTWLAGNRPATKI
jgi:aminoglycoside 3-N-acetyltransferase